jgi:hypothetical protein
VQHRHFQQKEKTLRGVKKPHLLVCVPGFSTARLDNYDSDRLNEKSHETQFL